MAYFLFVDESGIDRRESPYEVLAGVCIEDRDIWNLIDAINITEENILGLRYSQEKEEFKGKKFLKRKVFKQASLKEPISPEKRRELSKKCIRHGEDAGILEISALAQAKLAFVQRVLELCSEYRCKVFASIVDSEAPRPIADVLRKDYAFLFERYFYFLEDKGQNCQGIVVFDEYEKSKCNILIDQMERYFKETYKGKMRSSQIIPEPFFVHSDLTSLIQVSDLIAYTISWGFRRIAQLQKPRRDELERYVDQVAELRYRAIRDINDNPEFIVWSITAIDDLRGWEDKDE